MKIVVFGATGSVGRLAVQRLLEDGHAVTAFARTPARLGIAHPQLRLHQGDALDGEAVAGSLHGQDAAVVTLGAGMSRTSPVRSQGTLNVICGMQVHGVRRLVCQTTLGAHESWGNLDFFWKRIMFGLLLRPVFRDHELQEMLVRASGLDWTIVRPSAFTDARPGGPLREGFGGSERGLRLKVARSDVAEFLRRQVADLRYLHRAVGLST